MSKKKVKRFTERCLPRVIKQTLLESQHVELTLFSRSSVKCTLECILILKFRQYQTFFVLR